jgi:hypothetical protein
MTMNKILLGRLKSDAGTFADGENIYLTKHRWDCGWYWGFGYIGNKRCHFHFDSLLSIKGGCGGIKCLASELFQSTNITDKEWWVIRDLFIQAYALRGAAEVYRHGGYQTTLKGVTNIIQSHDMTKFINADLEKVLDTLWNYVCAAVNKKRMRCRSGSASTR